MLRKSILARRLLLAFAAPATTLSFTVDAHAQTPSQQLERVTVTGSNISRTDTETASPIQVLTREDIRRTGKTSLADVVRGISADNSGSISTAFATGFAAGAAGVSLRGLTTNATLVLVNGRRMAPYGLADDGQRTFVDLNNLPLEAVERVEVLKDGASAIYGSDAIAGVVNIILRKDYQGASAGVSYGQSYRGDGNAYRGFGSLGIGKLSEDKYNVFFSVEGTKDEAIDQNTRPGYLGTLNLNSLYPNLPDARLGGTSIVNRFPRTQIPEFALAPVDPVTGVGPYRTATACKSGQFAAPVTSGPIRTTGLCLTDDTKYNQVQPDIGRLNLFSRATLQVAPNAQWYNELGYFYTSTKVISVPTTYSAPWASISQNRIISSSLDTLPVGHPDNPFAVPARIRGVFESDAGRRASETESKTLRLVSGLTGSALGWEYDTGLGYIENKLDDTRYGYVRYSVVREGIDNGTYRLNNPAALPPGFIDRMSPALSRTIKSSVTFVDGKISRELADLPGGPLGLALGTEWRREKADSPAIPYTYEGDVIGVGYSAFEASRNIYALYGELNAPVLRWLELNAALRYDHYSDFGSTTNPKFGFKLTPVKQVSFRGTYSESFRAPGPAENGSSSSAGYQGFLNITNGNPDIKPERAKSYTLGLVVEPIRGTSASLDFWRIERKDEIIAPEFGAVDTAAIDAAEDPASPGTYPALAGSTVAGRLPGSSVSFDPTTGTIQAVSAPYINASRTNVDGFDVDLRTRFNLGEAGRILASLTWTHITSFKRRLDDGTEYQYAGTHGPYGLSSAAGTPKDKAVLSMTWERNPVSLTANMNLVSGMEIKNDKDDLSTSDEGFLAPASAPPDGERSCTIYDSNGREFPTGCRLPTFVTWDLFGKYTGFKRWELSFSILNVFNKRAPLDLYTYGGVNYNPTYHQAGAVGTFYTIGARYTF